MRAIDAYGELLRMNRVIVTTREAAARWQAEQRTAGRRLRVMEEAGLVRRLRRGLWALDPEIEPFVVAPYLTAPFPAYVSSARPPAVELSSQSSHSPGISMTLR